MLAGFPRRLVCSRGFQKLGLKTINLSGQSDDLGISTADLSPASVRNAVAIKDTQIINDHVLVGRLTRDPSCLGEAHVDGKQLVGSCFCSTKEFGEELVVLAEVYPFFGVNFLLEFFNRRRQSMEVVVDCEESHLLHLQLKVLHINDQVRFNHGVNHAK